MWGIQSVLATLAVTGYVSPSLVAVVGDVMAVFVARTYLFASFVLVCFSFSFKYTYFSLCFGYFRFLNLTRLTLSFR